MKAYKADLHIHTVLSPCADLDMSPVKIIEEAKRKGLGIIGITDHNSTKNCLVTQKLGAKHNIYVLLGIEINTCEEVHCLAFFPNEETMISFQDYIEAGIQKFPNDVNKFGHQIIVDAEENILGQEENLLIMSIDQGIEEIVQKVHELEGIVIPAHVNRQPNGLFYQLGVMPTDIDFDAIEIYPKPDVNTWLSNQPELKDYNLIQNSDAHDLQQIGKRFNLLYLNSLNFEEIATELKRRGEK